VWEKRVTTPDGHAWYVRRRWAKRQLPWKRRADYELSPAERDAIPILTDTDELLGPLGIPLIGLCSVDAEVGLFVAVALLALAVLGVFALAGVVWEWVVPFLVANIGWIGATLAAIGVLVVLDRLTRPWFIEAESARLFHAPRRIWRIQGWWRSRRAFRAVARAISEGRIDNERGVILFTERSTAR
jgi:cell division protein FtsW (lipid II flippase)